MAIPRTPIIDDDGTGTTGTVIDNAWKTELYNQIDAAGVATVVGNRRGTSTNAAAENLHSVAMGTLGAFDTILVEASFHTAPGSLQPIRLFYLGALGAFYEIARLDLVMGAATPKQIMAVTTRLRAPALGTVSIEATSWGAATSGPGLVQTVFTNLAGTDSFTSPWNLAVQYPGVPAGDTLYWAWTVTKSPKGGAIG